MSERKAKRRTTGSSGKSRTVQSDRSSTDINALVARARRNSTPLGVDPRYGVYGDFSSPHDLHETMNRVLAAREAFDALPPRVRREADNDPVRFLAMVYDETGVGLEQLVAQGFEISDEAREILGLPAAPEVPEALDSQAVGPEVKATPQGGE